MSNNKVCYLRTENVLTNKKIEFPIISLLPKNWKCIESKRKEEFPIIRTESLLRGEGRISNNKFAT